MTAREIIQHPAAPYVGPFALFMVLLAVMPKLGLEQRASLALWVVLAGAAIVYFSRGVLEFRPSRPLLSILLGVAVFGLWIAPDMLAPGWRSHWLFQNAITGSLKTSLSGEALRDPVSLALRSLRAILIVPILEELFWRGWLMRWLIKPEFQEVPLGTYARNAFWLVALFFAMEHGPYWEVGFLTGAVYNWWMVRTKRLSDLYLAHGVTNACLCAFVLITGRWEYWL
jgi:CAAX prenyl protease-like protein